MRSLAPDIPPHVADVIRSLPPDVKRSVKQAIRAIVQEPEIGAPLIGELTGFWKFRVRRFRVVYEVDRARGALRIVAIGHRSVIYDELSEAARRIKKRKRSPLTSTKPSSRDVSGKCIRN